VIAVPDRSTFLVFALASLALVVAPGPNLVYIVTRSVSQGRRAGLVSAVGVEAGTLVHVTAAAVGLSQLVATSALAFSVVKYAGAAYLLYLGLRALRRREGPDLTAATRPLRLPRILRDGIVVNVLNPKVALFFLAFLPQFVDPANGAATAQILALGVVFFGIALAVDVLYAIVAGALSGWLRRRPAYLRRQRFVVGGVYLALGVSAAGAGT
jgi:threonine/homoserine/homoserine lactone efflux protein